MAYAGLETEQRLYAGLKDLGCTIVRNGNLDHQFKLDFVVVQLPGHPSFLSLGVQLTTRTGDLKKMEEFLKLHQGIRITDQVAYLELDPHVDLNYGGVLTTLAVLLDVKFGRSYQRHRILGARIYPDCTYSIYLLEHSIAQLRKVKIDQTDSDRPRVNGRSMVQEIKGRLETYHRGKRNGQIRTATDERFSFRLSEVTDQTLAAQLNSLPIINGNSRLNVPVVFINGGLTDNGKPEAKSICLSTHH